MSERSAVCPPTVAATVNCQRPGSVLQPEQDASSQARFADTKLLISYGRKGDALIGSPWVLRRQKHQPAVVVVAGHQKLTGLSHIDDGTGIAVLVGSAGILPLDLN